MAAKDRYTKHIECPYCKAVGVLHVSENDYPFMRLLGRSIDEIDGNFSCSLENEVTLHFTCNTCGKATTKKF